MFLAAEELEVSKAMLDVEETLASLPAPPKSKPAVAAQQPVRRPRRAASDLLADFLVAYGRHEDIEPLPADVLKACLESRRSRTPSSTPVFASLMQETDRQAEVV